MAEDPQPDDRESSRDQRLDYPQRQAVDQSVARALLGQHKLDARHAEVAADCRREGRAENGARFLPAALQQVTQR